MRNVIEFQVMLDDDVSLEETEHFAKHIANAISIVEYNTMSRPVLNRVNYTITHNDNELDDVFTT